MEDTFVGHLPVAAQAHHAGHSPRSDITNCRLPKEPIIRNTSTYRAGISEGVQRIALRDELTILPTGAELVSVLQLAGNFEQPLRILHLVVTGCTAAVSSTRQKLLSSMPWRNIVTVGALKRAGSDRRGSVLLPEI